MKHSKIFRKKLKLLIKTSKYQKCYAKINLNWKATNKISNKCADLEKG